MHPVLNGELYDGQPANHIVFQVLLQQLVEASHHWLVIAMLLGFLLGDIKVISKNFLMLSPEQWLSSNMCMAKFRWSKITNNQRFRERCLTPALEKACRLTVKVELFSLYLENPYNVYEKLWACEWPQLKLFWCRGRPCERINDMRCKEMQHGWWRLLLECALPNANMECHCKRLSEANSFICPSIYPVNTDHLKFGVLRLLRWKRSELIF